MTPAFMESEVEQAALAWLQAIGWRVAHGPDVAPDMLAAERREYSEIVLSRRLQDALARLNPALPAEALEDASRKNDLDDQLFGTFSRCQDLLRQPPVQAESRAHLRALLSVAAGGVVFTTIHKFFPEAQGDRHPVLSARPSIVVIADEAHRSQYDFIDGRVIESRLFYCTRAGGFSERLVPLSGEARSRGSEVLAVVDRAIAAGFLPPAPRARACQICDFRDVCGPHEEARVKLKDQARLDELHALRDWP